MKNFNRSASAAALSIGAAADSRPALAAAPDRSGRASQGHRSDLSGQRPPAHVVRPRGQRGRPDRRAGHVQPASPLTRREARRRHQDRSGQRNQRRVGARRRDGHRASKSRPAQSARGGDVTGVVSRREPGRVRRAARGMLRDLPESLEWPTVPRSFSTRAPALR